MPYLGPAGPEGQKGARGEKGRAGSRGHPGSALYFESGEEIITVKGEKVNHTYFSSFRPTTFLFGLVP